MDNPDEKEIPESKIIITFSSLGSVNIGIDFINVTPLQVAAVAWMLEKKAETGFFQQQQKKIQVPNLGVIKP